MKGGREAEPRDHPTHLGRLMTAHPDPSRGVRRERAPLRSGPHAASPTAPPGEGAARLSALSWEAWPGASARLGHQLPGCPGRPSWESPASVSSPASCGWGQGRADEALCCPSAPRAAKGLGWGKEFRQAGSTRGPIGSHARSPTLGKLSETASLDPLWVPPSPRQRVGCSAHASPNPLRYPRPTFPTSPSPCLAHWIPAYSRRSINTDNSCLDPTAPWSLFSRSFPSGSEFPAGALSLLQHPPPPPPPHGAQQAWPPPGQHARWEEPCVQKVSPAGQTQPKPKCSFVPPGGPVPTHSLALG